MVYVLFALVVLVITFLLGSKHGQKLEQEIIADLVKGYDFSASSAMTAISKVRVRLTAKL